MSGDAWGRQGWEQFLQAKIGMLAEYEKAKYYAEATEVPTYHGRVAEAEFRDWLSTFLPERYGVTSGYLVSQGLDQDEPLTHFDVVIYDKLNAPTLWVEDNPDESEGGHSRAMPVEHVLSVFEVKSKLRSQTAKAATAHLRGLQPFLEEVPDPDERYPEHLPPHFSCGVVFFEVASEAKHSPKPLEHLIPPDSEVRQRFYGGSVLRCDDQDERVTGQLDLGVVDGDDEMETTIGTDGETLCDGLVYSDSQSLGGQHWLISLRWSLSGFAQFAYDILELLRGRYRPGYLSSWHGMAYPRNLDTGEES